MMRTSAPALVLALLAASPGCKEEPPLASPSAAPSAASASSAAPRASSAGATASAAPPAEAPRGGGAYERGSLLSYLPKECVEGRAYVDVRKVLGGDGGAMGSLVEKALLGGAKEGQKAEAVMKILKDGGIDPARSVQEIAACVTTAGSPVLAIGADTSQVKDPIGTLFAALEAAEGKGKAQLLDEGSLKYVKNPRGEVLGMVAPNVLVLAKNVDRLKEAAKTPGGAGGFEDATSNVLWLKMTGRDKADVAVREQGDAYDLVARFAPGGPAGQQLAAQPAAVVASLQQEAKRRADKLAATPLKALAPVVSGAKISAEGDRLRVEATIPQGLVAETIRVVASTPDDQLFRMLQ